MKMEEGEEEERREGEERKEAEEEKKKREEDEREKLSVDKCSENQEFTAGDEVSPHWGYKNSAISLEMKLVFNKILAEEILPGKNSHHFLVSVS